jgi:hypothetical protein
MLAEIVVPFPVMLVTSTSRPSSDLLLPKSAMRIFFKKKV